MNYLNNIQSAITLNAEMANGYTNETQDNKKATLLKFVKPNFFGLNITEEQKNNDITRNSSVVKLNSCSIDSVVNSISSKLSNGNLNLATELSWLKSQTFKDCLLQNELHVGIVDRLTAMIKKSINITNNEALFDISATLGSMFASGHSLVINNEKLWKLFVNFYNWSSSNNKIAFAEYLQESLPQIINLIATGYKYQLEKKSCIIGDNYPKWHLNYSDINPESSIKITHGGGYAFINNFCSGKNIGYRLEKGGLGLQVSPHQSLATEKFIKNRETKDYAPKATYFMDRPARLEAEIAVKYLLAANNYYEAAIDSSKIKYLTNIKISFVNMH